MTTEDISFFTYITEVEIAVIEGYYTSSCKRYVRYLLGHVILHFLIYSHVVQYSLLMCFFPQRQRNKFIFRTNLLKLIKINHSLFLVHLWK